MAGPTQSPAAPRAERGRWLVPAWLVALALVAFVRVWNASHGAILRGYDDFAHLGYVLFLDFYGAVPYADQGWAYFHPPLHYAIGWGLAQSDDIAILIRGLYSVAAASSFGVALLSAWLVHRISNARPASVLLVFVSVGLLPVFLYTTAMVGNEGTAAFFGTLGLALFIGNECRERPTVARAAASGLAIGLGMLTKVSVVLVLGCAGISLLVSLLRDRSRDGSRRIVARGLALAGVALVLASPFYVRNLLEFGTPTRLGTQYPHTAALEAKQGPGTRSIRDFVYLPLGLFANPRPDQEPLLRSVWGSAYVQAWADVRPEWDFVWAKNGVERVRRNQRVMVVLGLGPTLLALLGAILAGRDLVRGRRRDAYVPLFAMSLLALVAFGSFAIQVPRFSATKASYLLGLTLPYAAFLARAFEALAGRGLALRALAASLVLVAAGASALAHTPGLVTPKLLNSTWHGTLQFYFGRYDAAHRYSERKLRTPTHQRDWNGNLGAVELIRGNPWRARAHYAAIPPESGQTPFAWNALAVSNALAGRVRRAATQLDQAIEAGAVEVGHANRGALRAVSGDLVGAESDLRTALSQDPGLAPAWQALAEVLDAAGRSAEAQAAREQAVAASRRTPRGHPHGVPEGLALDPSPGFSPRWLLWLEDGKLLLARPPFRSEDALAMRKRAGQRR